MLTTYYETGNTPILVANVGSFVEAVDWLQDNDWTILDTNADEMTCVAHSKADIIRVFEFGDRDEFVLDTEMHRFTKK